MKVPPSVSPSKKFCFCMDNKAFTFFQYFPLFDLPAAQRMSLYHNFNSKQPFFQTHLPSFHSSDFFTSYHFPHSSFPSYSPVSLLVTTPFFHDQSITLFCSPYLPFISPASCVPVNTTPPLVYPMFPANVNNVIIPDSYFHLPKNTTDFPISP